MSTLDDIVAVHADDAPHQGPVDNEMIARDLLIEAERLARKVDLTERTLKAIELQYQNRIGVAEKRIAEIRQMLQLYVEQHGPVRFEDVGQVFLSKRKEKVKIVDAPSFLSWAKEHDAPVFEKSVPDLTSAQKWALEYLHTTGEVPPGAEYHEAGAGLTIRGVS